MFLVIYVYFYLKYLSSIISHLFSSLSIYIVQYCIILQYITIAFMTMQSNFRTLLSVQRLVLATQQPRVQTPSIIIPLIATR